MNENPILQELRATREKLLAEAGGTLDGLVAQLQHNERESDRTFYRPIKHGSALKASEPMPLPQAENLPPSDRH